ncbi:hypothetical protein [Candidatus Berkiella aquae]|uniref:Uncharacterized protein n=1 Tax=Candidatus Berkiella aquae TaxID=295108 RepID=A0A0Q9YMF7_9GAMM|nr:hypothetical protein [Candidatus Berkiella aquae]MCS5710373.1 hypothetical protein [Candidatus Berkiella aquae]
MGEDDTKKVRFEIPAEFPPLPKIPPARWSDSIDHFGEVKAKQKECLDKLSTDTKYKILYQGCNEEPKTDARKAFLDYLQDEMMQVQRKDPPNIEGTTLEGFLGPQGLALYQAAIEEEANSKAFRKAVFQKASNHRPGETWENRVIAPYAGPSAAGKSATQQSFLDEIDKAVPKTGKQDGNFVVSVDGGVEREVSQIRGMALQLAVAKGFYGITDLDKNKSSVKVKELVEEAALATEGLNIVIPKTYTSEALNYPQGTVGKKDFAKYDKVDNGKAIVAIGIVEANHADVARNGNSRAWNTDDNFTEDNIAMNKKPPCESKAYHDHYKAGTNLSEQAVSNYNQLKADDKPRICVRVTSEFTFIKPDATAPCGWKLADPKDKWNKDMVGILKRDFEKYEIEFKAHQAEHHYLRSDKKALLKEWMVYENGNAWRQKPNVTPIVKASEQHPNTGRRLSSSENGFRRRISSAINRRENLKNNNKVNQTTPDNNVSAGSIVQPKVSFNLPPLPEVPRWSDAIDNFGEMKDKQAECLGKLNKFTKYNILYQGCDETPKTDARKAFLDFLQDEKMQAQRKNPPNMEGTKLEDFLGPRGLELYRAAIEEEANSKAFRDAVFQKSSNFRPGETWANRVIAPYAGPSAAGKSATQKDFLDKIDKVIPRTGAKEGNFIVSVDGGVEREVSQMRGMVLQLAVAKGFYGITDLDKNKSSVKVKEIVEEAALATKGLNLVIPKTYTDEALNYPQGTVGKSDFAKYDKVDDGAAIVAIGIVEAEHANVAKNGNSRAWNTDDNYTESQIGMNKKPPCESKAYHDHFKAGTVLSQQAVDNYNQLKADGKPRICVTVKSEFTFIKPDPAEPCGWKLADKNDKWNKDMVGILERDFEKYKNEFVAAKTAFIAKNPDREPDNKTLLKAWMDKSAWKQQALVEQSVKYPDITKPSRKTARSASDFKDNLKEIRDSFRSESNIEPNQNPVNNENQPRRKIARSESDFKDDLKEIRDSFRSESNIEPNQNPVNGKKQPLGRIAQATNDLKNGLRAIRNSFRSKINDKHPRSQEKPEQMITQNTAVKVEPVVSKPSVRFELPSDNLPPLPPLPPQAQNLSDEKENKPPQNKSTVAKADNQENHSFLKSFDIQRERKAPFFSRDKFLEAENTSIAKNRPK